MATVERLRRRVVAVLLGEGWLTLLLLLALLLVTSRAAEVAHWVEAPSLMLTTALAVVVGFALARSRIHGLLALLLGALLGAVAAYLLTTTLVDAEGWTAQVSEANRRLLAWWEAASKQGISTDLLPFALFLTAAAWAMGFFSAWAAFRWRSLWATILPSGVGILTNLSYLPEPFFVYFWWYLSLAVALGVTLTGAQFRRWWDRQRIGYPRLLDLSFLGNATIMAGVVAVVAIALPAGTVLSPSMRNAWERVRTPTDWVEGEFNRLFAGVEAQKTLPLRLFQTSLPFQEAAERTKEPLFFMDSPLPAYWRGRIYTTYLAAGWRVDGADTAEAPRNERAVVGGTVYRDQAMVEYRVEVLSPASFMPHLGIPLWVDMPARFEVSHQATYRLHLKDLRANSSLPGELQDAAYQVARRLASVGGLGLTEALLDELPRGAVVTEIVKSGRGGRSTVTLPVDLRNYPRSLSQTLDQPGEVLSVAVSLVSGPAQDVLSVQPRSRLLGGAHYRAASLLSLATEEALRQAGRDYPTSVAETYLQFPQDFPQRVRQLAVSLTRRATNPYDKATAIESYLRTFKHNAAAPSPPFGRDAVEYFLFTLREGRSEYFASAMTLMLRSVGVPARLVTGFGPGEWQKDRRGFILRDQDYHVWVEAYFPNYGWVEFEPSPIYPQRPRGVLALSPMISGEDIASGEVPSDLLGEDLMDAEVGEGGEDGDGGRQRGGFGFLPLPFVLFGSPMGTGGLLFVIFLATVAGALWLLWRQLFVSLPHPALAYDRLCRLSRLLGHGPQPWHTPTEFANTLSSSSPAISEDVRIIAQGYVRSRYGGKVMSSEEAGRLQRAWRRVRGALLARLLSGPGQAKGPRR